MSEQLEIAVIAAIAAGVGSLLSLVMQWRNTLSGSTDARIDALLLHSDKTISRQDERIVYLETEIRRLHRWADGMNLWAYQAMQTIEDLGGESPSAPPPLLAWETPK